MLKSLKSRGLSSGLLIIIFILVIAYYGHTLLRDSLHTSNETGLRINNLFQLIDKFKKPVNGLEVSLYQFLLSLEEDDKLTVKINIDELQSQIPLIRQDDLVNENPLLLIKVKGIIQQQELLINQVSKILVFTNQQRFPTMRLMFERINPAIEKFNANIQIIESLIDNLSTSIPVMQTRELIHQLKYIWSQSVSNTRLLISSRTGIFGNPRAAMEYLDNNSREYNAELHKLLQKLNVIAQDKISDLEFNDSIQHLANSLETRLKTLEMLKTGLSQNDWRIDRHIMAADIKPLLASLNHQISELEHLTSGLATINFGHVQYASEQLSNFLWLFVFIFVALILTTYLVYEHWIRIPMDTVVKAMHSEASQQTSNPIKRTGAIEIDYLIETFEIMQTQIRLRQQRLTSILQNAGEGIVVINEHDRIDSFNFAAERIFNQKRECMLDSHIMALFDLADGDQINRILANVHDPSVNHQQYLCSGIRADGSSFPMDLTISHMKLDEKIYNILAIRDATERINNEFDLNRARLDAEGMQEELAQQVKQLDLSLNELKQTQKQLVESEKMASLAGLVAGVAHEINTPVGVSVTASSHLQAEIKSLKNRYADGSLAFADLGDYFEDVESAAQIIQNNLQRAATLIHSFKQVAVDQSSEAIRPFNLHEYLQEIVLNLQPRLKKTRHKINITVPDTINLNTVPGALSQIITNLIINSLVHAFDKSKTGNITISAVCKQDQVELIYQDDGKGMDEQIRGKIFEPFFTTQRGSGGSGLGMHITYNLVTTTLKGTIQCNSAPDQGSQFIILFPLSREV